MTSKAREALAPFIKDTEIKTESGLRYVITTLTADPDDVITALSDAGQLRSTGAIEKCPYCDREWAGAFPGCHIVTEGGYVIKCPIKPAGDG